MKASEPMPVTLFHTLHDGKDRLEMKNRSRLRRDLFFVFCGGNGTRTRDLLHAMQTRYQLRHTPIFSSLLPSLSRVGNPYTLHRLERILQIAPEPVQRLTVLVRQL